MNKEIQHLIETFNLIEHPEGGYYSETIRSSEKNETEKGTRSLYTSIYFLLTSEQFSAFHKLSSDEMWYFHQGSPIEITLLDNITKGCSTVTLGDENYQCHIPKNTWFASKVSKNGNYSLCSCVVVPGFDFNDFHLANRNQLIDDFPSCSQIITQLTR